MVRFANSTADLEATLAAPPEGTCLGNFQQTAKISSLWSGAGYSDSDGCGLSEEILRILEAAQQPSMVTTNLEDTLNLAMGLHRTGQFAAAEAEYRRCLMLEPQNPDAFYYLGILLNETRRQVEALNCLAMSLRLNPAIASRWVDLGAIAAELGDRSGAKHAFTNALNLDPGLNEVRAALGDIHTALAEYAAARLCYEALLPVWPEHAALRSNLANALWYLQQYEAAEVHARRALEIDPRLAEAHNNLGNILRMTSRLEQAVNSYILATTLNPGMADALKNLGIACTEVGSHVLLAAAEDAFNRALALNSADAAAMVGLADCKHLRGASGEAEALYRQVIKLDRTDSIAVCNLATMLLQQDRRKDAEELLEESLRLRPADSDMLAVLADCRKVGQRADAAEDLYLQSLTARPSLRAWNNLGLLRLSTGRASEAVDAFTAALSMAPTAHHVHSNLLFALQHLPASTPESLREAHANYGRQVMASTDSELVLDAIDRSPDRQLVVGFMSPDFREHPVSRFLLPLLRKVDKSGFRVILFSNTERSDQMTTTLSALADGWVDCSKYGDRQLAEAVRAEKIDVLIDLAGHTSGNRLPAFACRPAPVQMTYLGYPGSTGLSQVDYRITDTLIDPEGAETFFEERLLRMDSLMLTYDPAPDIHDVDLTTPAAMTRNGWVTFGSFANASKINDVLLDTWADILLRLPDSRLHFVAIPAGRCAARVRERLVSRGIEPSRVYIQGLLQSRQFRAAMLDVDIALDSFPVNGGTTTFECLWMGLPVIALAGDRTVSRFGLSILTKLGFPEFVAHDRAEYIDRAVALAQNPSAMVAFRASIRDRLLAGPGTNCESLRREFFDAVRAAWREFCARDVPGDS